MDFLDPPVFVMDLNLDANGTCSFTLPDVVRFSIQCKAPGYSLTTRTFRLAELGDELILPMQRGIDRRLQVLGRIPRLIQPTDMHLVLPSVEST